ncbi:26S proteasome non-ATPase regulatory subunit 2 [Chelonus insularis]|uniref:26S proteasome non-ATPase regulatory subunit 2 n=1 Tax=Chelonus insularis TaxID=460826 RepID=UPI0015882AD1|nr:26S proteasome non-ATPase regulatory subunit 2 [Chelonus insularis]
MPESTKAESSAPKEVKNNKEEEKNDLSEEDKQLQEELELLVERLQDSDRRLHFPALEQLRAHIRASTTSMTSVPKPLKFMRPHYETMKAIYQKLDDTESRELCSDIISVLAMTMGEGRECLKFRLSGSSLPLSEWGHEYVRHLSGELAAEWDEVSTGEDAASNTEKLIELVHEIIPYNMAHNAETEACDLLMEIERLDLLQRFVDESAYQRVCLYLTSCVPYVADPENSTLLKAAWKLYRKFRQYPQALRLAMQLNDLNLVGYIFLSCTDLSIQKQLAYMLGRQQIFLELPESIMEYDDLIEIMSNSHLNNHFLNLARELDIMEPKTPEDVYKLHLENSRPPFGGGQVDSARQNLAASFVNGFVNAAFGQDKLLIDDGNKWLFKNKEHGMLSATASLGLVLLWDVDGGLTPIDKYLYSSEDYIKSGALLACGIVNCGVRNECDPALALLSDYVLHSSNTLRIGAIVGLGLAYAGSNREAVLSLLTPVLTDPKSNWEVVGTAGLALGMVAVGSCNIYVTTAIMHCLMEKTEADLKDTYARFLPLGLALCFLGKQEAAEAIIAALEIIPEPFKSMSTTLVEVCAYAGTGNVLKIQHLLHICSEHYEPSNEKDDKSDRNHKEKDKKDKEDKEKKDDKEKDKDSKEKDKEKDKTKEKDLSSRQAIAVLGIALIAMGEEIGSEMAYRTFGHLLRYCEPVIRRSVPLALGLISVSNPKLNIIDTLSKFSHDSDPEVAHNAIFAMGLVGAGTNNARLAAMLRQLAQYHAKDPNNLFMVRIAQGLTHLGKGTLTLCPYHSDRQLLSPVALAGLLATIIGFLDVKNIILGRSHYLLYTLAAAMQPRMLVTFDEELNPLPVPVRVGIAVDVVGQAGKPKTITGFQTHTTPVLLAYGERAELATEEYIPLTPIMEGFVILRKNPEFVP